MRNKKNKSKNNQYSVPQLRVVSINLFQKNGKSESGNKPENEESNSSNLPSADKTSSNLPDFYEPKIKPKNFDPL